MNQFLRANYGGVPQRPAPGQPQPGNQEQAGDRAHAPPFEFILRDFIAGANHADGNNIRQQQANTFLGAAAMFTMEQLMQRAR
jgi:hypothetical protein